MAKGKIPVYEADLLSRKFDQPVVLIFGLDRGGESFNVTTWGATAALCKHAAWLADRIIAGVAEGAIAPSPAEPTLTPAVAQTLQALKDLLAGIEAEVNKQGAGGYVLARITDARHALNEAERQAERARLIPARPGQFAGGSFGLTLLRRARAFLDDIDGFNPPPRELMSVIDNYLRGLPEGGGG